MATVMSAPDADCRIANLARPRGGGGGPFFKAPVETMVVAPIFRGNWATDDEASADVQPLLRHQRFLDAARRLFNAEIVRPQNMYVNLTWQLPFPQGMGHTDVPAFRGFDRSRYPDDIDLDEVLRRFARDLESRAIPFELPEDPLRDPTFIRLLTETYVRSPSTFAPAQP